MRPPVNDHRITGYNLSLLPNHLLSLLEADVKGPRQWLERSGRSAGHPAWGFLYHLALSVLSPAEDNLVIETDSNLGSTTIVLAQALADSGRLGTVRSIEADRQLQAEARQRLELTSLSTFVEHLEGQPAERLPEACRDSRPVRLAVLGGHRPMDEVVAAFAAIETHLTPGGVVVFDHTAHAANEGEQDTHVNAALHAIAERWGGSLVNLPYCSWGVPGMALWQRGVFGA
jgi:predicted O-methyltransferase YrrM